MTDLAIITEVTPPGIWQQALYKHQFLIIHDDEFLSQGEPVSIGVAEGFGGEYQLTDWIGRGGTDTFTADRVVGGRVELRRFSVLPWWYVLVFGAGVTTLGWYAKKKWEEKK